MDQTGRDVLRDLLLYLSVNPSMNPNLPQLMVLINSPSGYTEGWITRTGQNMWNVDIPGTANMRCTDIQCVVNFVSQFDVEDIYQRGSGWPVTYSPSMVDYELPTVETITEYNQRLREI